jgi:Ca-activated chloride channel family protein
VSVVRRIGAILALLLAAGCSTGPAPAPTNPDSSGPATTLRVLGGSELADLRPILDDAAAATGVTVKLDPVGTLEGAEQVESGAALTDHDAIWFSSNRYLALRPETQAKLGTSVDIASSPVVLGLRRSIAQKLGWVGRPVTWSEIASAAGKGQFSYGMTDPSASNTGFSTVVAVATALVGSGAALTEEQAASTAPALRDFFSAQTLSTGSSGVLQEAYVRRATGKDPGPLVDGLINYESVLLELDASGTLPEPLELIRPADGVVTADYPLTVLAGASEQARDAHRRLAAYLRTPEVQRKIMSVTHRRPAVPGIALAPELSTATLVELPFPSQAVVVDTLLTSWFDKVRRPSRTIYVLDTSGSMGDDDRIQSLKRALAGLAGADPSLTGQYSRFRGREQVTLLPFSDAPDAPQTFAVSETDPSPDRQRILDAANALTPGGGTAIYDSIERAYAIAGEQIAADPNRFTSIVLMTDGKNTAGADIASFRTFVALRKQALRGVAVFPVLFGDGDNAQMTEIAQLTGGTTFDARAEGLADAFKEIRGYV